MIPTYVDLLLSSYPPFPLASAVDEAERTAFRLAVLGGHMMAELQYMSLSPTGGGGAGSSESSGGGPAVVCMYLEQLVRLLVWLNVDVLPHLSPLLAVLFRLGSSWDGAVRRRAWVCVGVVMDVGGERMRWHTGKVEEKLRLCEVDCERQMELNERVSGWDESGRPGGESVVVLEARERTEGWKETKRLVIDMRDRLGKRWPRKAAVEQTEAVAEQSDVSVTS